MKSLLLNKYILFLVILFVFSGCASHKSAEKKSLLPIPYLAQKNDGLVYNAAFHYKDFNASGLLVLKRLKESEYHVVLLSKFGLSLMEFKLNDEGVQWIKTFDQLKKKSVQKLLEKDFRTLLLTNLEKPDKVRLKKENDELLVFNVKDRGKTKIQVTPENKQVVYAENKGFINPAKSKVKFHYSNQQKIPQTIILSHNFIDMGFELNLLKINHAER